MTALVKKPIIYPCGDGEPVAETYDHVYAILTILAVLKQYLTGQQATVLANQFFYYAMGFPKLRVAPDVMVIFNVASGGRDRYISWEEGDQAPSVIFEVTSPGTKSADLGEKKDLYERLGVQEYWLFDPKGEWIAEKLRGFRLQEVQVEGITHEIYLPITDGRSEPLGLRLEVEDRLVSFYREDNGEKLLLLSEMAEALEQEHQARLWAEQAADRERQARTESEQRTEQAQQQAEAERRRAEALAERLRALGIDPDTP